MRITQLASICALLLAFSAGGLLAQAPKKDDPTAKLAPVKPAAPGTPIRAEKPALAVPAPQKTETAQAAKAPASNPKAVEIVNHYIEALGGRKVLEGIADRVTKFRVIKHASTGDTVAAMNLYLKKDYKIREEWNIEGINIKDKPLAFVQVYNGSEGWVQMFGTVSPLEGKTLSLFVWDKLLDDFFCHWDEDGYTVDYVSAGTVDNDPVDIIETADFGSANKARYFFSKASGLLVKREWHEQGQNGMAKKETFYKKYKKLPFSDNSSRSLQFALVHEIYEDGDLDTTREFTEVKMNSNLADSIFERPEGEEFKGAIGGPVDSPSSPGAGAGAKAEKVTPGGHPPVGGHPPILERPPQKPAAPPAVAPPAVAPKVEPKK